MNHKDLLSEALNTICKELIDFHFIEGNVWISDSILIRPPDCEPPILSVDICVDTDICLDSQLDKLTKICDELGISHDIGIYRKCQR